MALTPVAVVMFRYNNPDAVLTLLLVGAAWALWSAIETGRTGRLVLCGALVGLAFTTKSLEAFIVLPAFGLVYLWCGPPRLGRRVVQLLWAALALLVSSAWWVALVELWPAADRPYIGGSTNNSEFNLIFGYNGFSRVFGSGGAGPGGAGGPSFAGSPGVLRMFNDLLGGQIAWLLPLALAGLVAGLWITRAGRRHDLGRAGFVLWGGWTLMYLVVFSDAKGIFHPYYTVVLAPGVAALAGAGSVALWRLGRDHRGWAPVLPACVVGTAVWAAVLLGRTPGYDRGLATAVVVIGALAAALLLAWLLGVRSTLLAGAGIVLGTVSALAAPAAYSLTTVRHPPSGSLAAAGPSAGGAGGFGGFGAGGGVPGALAGRRGATSAIGRAFAERFAERFAGRGPLAGGVPGGGGTTSVDPALLAFLEAHQHGARYMVAVSGSQAAEPFILGSSGRGVMAMGGFTGSDPAPTLAEFKHLVSQGEIHYVLVGGGGVPGIFGGAAGGTGGAFGGAAGLSGGPTASETGGAGALPGAGFPGGGGSLPTGGASGAGGFPGGEGLPSGAGRGFAGGLPGGRGFPGGAGGGFGGGGGSSTAVAIDSWVKTHGTEVPAAQIGGSSAGTLYYVPTSAAG
jgi:4-amino-4-deoxy-L-arabinose transferase-like glycosyltransferase